MLTILNRVVIEIHNHDSPCQSNCQVRLNYQAVVQRLDDSENLQDFWLDLNGLIIAWMVVRLFASAEWTIGPQGLKLSSSANLRMDLYSLSILNNVQPRQIQLEA